MASVCALSFGAFWTASSLSLADIASIEDTVGTTPEVTYWLFQTGGETQTINLDTDNVLVNNSRAGLIDPTKSVIPRKENAGKMEKDFQYGWYTYSPTTFFHSESKSFTENKVLTYDILYNGNAILIWAKDNPKLYYALENPSTGEKEFKWRLVENKITVPVKATYTYTKFNLLPDNVVKYKVKNNRWVDLGGNSGDANSLPETVASTLVPSATEDDIYADTNDEKMISENGGFQTHSILYPTEETITYTDNLEFYIIDTGCIMDGQASMDLYLKSNTHPDTVTKNFGFTRNGIRN